MKITHPSFISSPEQLDTRDLELVLAIESSWPGQRFYDTICLASWIMPCNLPGLKLS